MRIVILLLLSVFVFADAKADETIFQNFLEKRCLDCHDEDTKKGDLSLEALGHEITEASAEHWLKALEQIERGYMPPAKKKQPAPDERRSAAIDLEKRLVEYHQKSDSAKPAMLRRLNRKEYLNTIRDLFRMEMGSFDPTSEFPDDNRTHGFSTDGEKLVTSSFLLRRYLEAAEGVVERAIQFGPKPETRHWDLLPPFDRTTKSHIYAEADHFKKKKQAQPYQTFVTRTRGAIKAGYHPVDELRVGVPESGWYKIRIKAAGKFRYADMDPSKFAHFPPVSDVSEPIRLSLFTGTLQGIDPENKEALDFAATHEQSGERLLGTWDLPDDDEEWLECRVWLDRGDFPKLAYPNGPSNSNNRLYRYFRESKHVLLDKEKLARFEKEAPSDWGIFLWFESPRIQVSKIEIDGPLNDLWPPASHQVVLGDIPYKKEDAEKIILKFASRAWRRPAVAEEVAPIVKLVRAAEQGGMAPEAALQEGIKAILCSPEFLYREEKSDTLSRNEIASRLAYFLWASMPDEHLLKRSAESDFDQAKILRQEAMRLLNDARSDAFVDEFLDGWLGLNKLGTMAPDINKFAAYYRDDLEPAMRTETRLFFRHLLNTNGSIDRLLDSDYSFLNKELAQLYGIDPKVVASAQGKKVEGLRQQDFRQDVDGRAPSLTFARVKLNDARRGGVLGQASVLTLSANGVDTSPVIRGVWLLENILGAPPSPPPPSVKVPEPDTRGTTTIRERLQKHRESPSCHSCHQHMDPPGFALENFDAIGRWRGHYMTAKQKPLVIDASGEYGKVKFKDVVGFKAELLNHRDQFARCLVEKLLVHALGRELEVTDRPHIRKIVETAARDGYRLRDLVLLCVESEIFRRK